MGGHFVFYVQAADGSFRGPVSSTLASEKQWYHIAAVFEEGCMALYVDGRLDGEKTCDHKGFQSQPRDTREILVGHYETDQHSSYYEGRIADVRVFARALTEDDIRDIRASSIEQSPIAVSRTK